MTEIQKLEKILHDADMKIRIGSNHSNLYFLIPHKNIPYDTDLPAYLPSKFFILLDCFVIDRAATNDWMQFEIRGISFHHPLMCFNSLIPVLKGIRNGICRASSSRTWSMVRFSVPRTLAAAPDGSYLHEDLVAKSIQQCLPEFMAYAQQVLDCIGASSL